MVKFEEVYSGSFPAVLINSFVMRVRTRCKQNIHKPHVSLSHVFDLQWTGSSLLHKYDRYV